MIRGIKDILGCKYGITESYYHKNIWKTSIFLWAAKLCYVI